MRISRNQYSIAAESCPKCGGRGEILSMAEVGRRMGKPTKLRGIQCCDCGYTVEGRTIKEAAELWNTNERG